MLRLTAPSDALLDRVLADARTAEFSYVEVGATAGSADLPSGYRIDRYERSLGAAAGRFERAVYALRHWQAHIGAGVRVYPADAMAEIRESGLLIARTLGLWAILPCRVVTMLETKSWFGLAYGTLPGHLECGEVEMSVERTGDGEVVARIVSFSKTVDPLARAAAPVARRIQTRFTNGYLDALEAAVQASSSPSQRSASK